MVRNAAFAVPGDLATPTGGYAYDRRIIAELSLRDWRIEVVDLGDGFPYPAAATRAAACARLAALRPGDPVVIDGLAFGVLAEAAAARVAAAGYGNPSPRSTTSMRQSRSESSAMMRRS